MGVGGLLLEPPLSKLNLGGKENCSNSGVNPCAANIWPMEEKICNIAAKLQKGNWNNRYGTNIDRQFSKTFLLQVQKW